MIDDLIEDCRLAIDNLRAVEPIENVAVTALRTLLASQPDSDAKVACAWKVAAGPSLAQATTTSWSAGVLHVRAKSDAWRREVRHARPMLLQRVQSLVGRDAVREIRLDAVESPTTPQS